MQLQYLGILEMRSKGKLKFAVKGLTSSVLNSGLKFVFGLS